MLKAVQINSQGTFCKVLGCTGEVHVLLIVFIFICTAAALRSRRCCPRPCVSSQRSNCVWQSLCWQLVMQMEPRHILPGIPAWNPCLSPFILIKPLLNLALVNKISLEIKSLQWLPQALVLILNGSAVFKNRVLTSQPVFSAPFSLLKCFQEIGKGVKSLPSYSWSLWGKHLCDW